MSNPKLFRMEAVENHGGRGLRAELVALDPGATAWGFGLLCAGMLAAVMFLAVGRLNEYATGPAFVQVDGQTAITADGTGVVAAVRARPGAAVRAGEELLRLDDSREQTELQAATQLFDDQLSKLLLNPDDPMARESMAALRSRRELAQERLEQRVVRAPYDGVVGDVRVQAGQVVEPGLRLIELQSRASSAFVTAILPGRYQPMLHEGSTLRFQIDGFSHVAHQLVILRVGEQIIGPREASRFVGRDLADAFAIAGPVVIVQARLPSMSFLVDGQRYAISSGMLGSAEAVVRNEVLAYTFIPSLKQWTERLWSTGHELSRGMFGGRT